MSEVGISKSGLYKLKVASLSSGCRGVNLGAVLLQLPQTLILGLAKSGASAFHCGP